MILAFSGLAAASGTDVPFVCAEMRQPDFWIARHPEPDRVVMTPAQITAFNQGLRGQGLTEDLAALPSFLPGKKIAAEMDGLALGLFRRELFRRDGTLGDADLFAALTKAVALDALPEQVRVRYAFTVVFTDQRLVPTDEPLYETPGDVHFDQVQNSGLDPATPVVVLHQSADGVWLFVKDGISSGWVKRGQIAFCDRASWLKAFDQHKSAVVVSARAPIYLDETLSMPSAIARMGSRFMLKRIKAGVVEVLYPLQHPDGRARFVSAFIAARDIMPGFLPYTPRMVMTQAFKLLDAPYGWGDMNGDQDCSRFIHMVLATMGLDLPRNSGEQGHSGVALGDFGPGDDAQARFALISQKGVGALTLLRLKGHIMLYLGRDKDRLYALHAMWAYREKGLQGDVPVILGRVLVSDLSLGEGSSKGSLLQRVVSVRYLGGSKDNH